MERHRKTHNLKKGPKLVIKCDVCKKIFDEEWKLNAPKKNHNTYKCDQCDRIFSSQDIKQKHKEIFHENVKLYCHYFNNEKDCPFKYRGQSKVN